MNLGVGSRASRSNAWFVAFVRKSMRRFARLIRSGCATRPPVIEERLVLSDESITPRSVAPSGSWAYNINSEKVKKIKRRNQPALTMQHHR